MSDGTEIVKLVKGIYVKEGEDEYWRRGGVVVENDMKKVGLTEKYAGLRRLTLIVGNIKEKQ